MSYTAARLFLHRGAKGIGWNFATARLVSPKVTTVAKLQIALCLILGLSGLAVAAPERLTEEDISPPVSVVGGPRESAPKKALPGVSAPEEVPSQEEAPAEAAPIKTPGEIAPKQTSSTSQTEKPVAVAGYDNGDLTYTIRPGDTTGSIAGMFRVNAAELLRANHMRADAILRIGAVLRVPNPYARQVDDLKAQVAKLSDELESARRKTEAMESDAGIARGRIDELAASNRDLGREVRTLPRWRTAAVAAGAAVLLMLGITTIALLDWFLTRRRFRVLAQMNESLRRLDQKYQAIVAKAELRFQQLYGRRRHGIPEGQDLGRIPEDYEIERLDRELKEVLEIQLERMGGSPGRRRRSWLRFFSGNVAAPVEARSTRR